MILRVLPASSLWRDVKPAPGFNPAPVPLLQGNDLGMPGTLNDGTVVYGGTYTALNDDGELRAQAETDLRRNLGNYLPDRGYKGPVCVSYEGFTPKDTSSVFGPLDASKPEWQEWYNALSWKRHQEIIIRQWCPGAVLWQYSYAGVPDWGRPTRIVRDLYPTQDTIASQMTWNAARASVPAGVKCIPLVTDWFRGQPYANTELSERFYAAQLQTAYLMAQHTGEIWLWGQAGDARELAMVNAGMGRLGKWVGG